MIDLQRPSFNDAFELSEKYKVPLHPYYNLFWHDITVDDLIILSDYIKKHGRIADSSLILPKTDEIKKILIELGALHKQKEGNLVIDRYTYPIIRCCGLNIEGKNIIEEKRHKILENYDKNKDILSLISHLAGITVKAKAPFRIGTRMGRPEKAAERKMRPPPHVLFPIGNYGGNQRLVRNAASFGKIEV